MKFTKSAIIGIIGLLIYFILDIFEIISHRDWAIGMLGFIAGGLLSSWDNLESKGRETKD